jgi:hypothetical protein
VDPDPQRSGTFAGSVTRGISSPVAVASAYFFFLFMVNTNDFIFNRNSLVDPKLCYRSGSDFSKS